MVVIKKFIDEKLEVGTYDYGVEFKNGNLNEEVVVGSYDYGTELQNGGIQEELVTESGGQA